MLTFEIMKSVLGRPYHESPLSLLYCGDCVELLSKLPSETVPLTVTSPPYNIGKEYEAIRDLADYLNWCEIWTKAIHRVSTATGAFWLNLGYVAVDGRAKALPLPYLIWDRIPFYLVQEVIWNYGAGVAGRKFFSPRNEKFLWYVKSENEYTFNLDDIRDPDVKYPNQKKNGKLKCNPLGKNPSDVWQIPKVTSGKDRASSERTAHPAQFPVALVDRIVRASSNEGELVLDPFMGSGSLAEAAIRAGRRVVGFEISADYLAIAAKRIQDVHEEIAESKRQQFLFNEARAQIR